MSNALQITKAYIGAIHNLTLAVAACSPWCYYHATHHSHPLLFGYRFIFVFNCLLADIYVREESR